jgi:DNA-binding SARP family transcriptional activator
LVEFQLLGNVEVRVGEELIDVGHARQKCVLAVLLVDANREVAVDKLVERVWGGQRLPVRPVGALQTYVSLLRRALASAGSVVISRQRSGYRAAVDAELVDLHLFRSLLAQARAAPAAGRLLGKALGLWRGEPFAGLDTPWVSGLRAELALQRHTARLDLTDIQLRRGKHAALLSGLAAQVVEQPQDERLAGQLMLALYRSGRQADALAQYHRIRHDLAGELGIDPSPSLRRLHQQILAGDPALTPRVQATSARRRGRAVPRELPAATAYFSGREQELAVLTQLTDRAGRRVPGAPRVCLVIGSAGVGKTALAVRWAHEAVGRFPDGQLFASLRGFGPSGTPAAPAEVIRQFLASLGVTPGQVPADPESQAALYRSLLAGRRLIIVLDNVRDPAQVRPLLPGSPGCLVLVTSRNQLTGLAVSVGVRVLSLGVLPEAEARVLLERLLGCDRAGAEPGAVGELVRLCAGLPLALTNVTARVAARPRLPLAVVAAGLGDGQARLDGLGTGDPATDVRSVFSWSYRQLSAGAARMFRLLGIHPGPEIAVPAAASLAGRPAGEANRMLDELAAAHLVSESLPGRYACHDLMRAYAAELAGRYDSREDRRAASARMLDHYLHASHAAARLLRPARDPVTLTAPGPGVTPEVPADRAQALAWFEAEHRVLLSVIAHAGRRGLDVHAGQVPGLMTYFLHIRGD